MHLKINEMIDTSANQKLLDSFSNSVGIAAIALKHKAQSTSEKQLNQTALKITSNKASSEIFETECKRLLMLLDGIDDVIYVADPETYELLHANEALTANWGKDAIGKKCYKVLQDRTKPCPFCTNEKIFGEFLGQSYVWEFQNEVNRRWYRCSDKAIQWVDGRMVRFEIAADITPLKLLEEELKNKNIELERSNKELEQFAYVASHDLQEPLRMVASYVQLLKKRYHGKLDADADDFIYFAVDGATRMQQLVNDLLAYSRIGTHGKPFASIDCASVLNKVQRNLEVAVEENGARITHDSLPTIFADDIQMVQLFQNLIGNAIKFRGKEPPKIHISVVPAAEFKAEDGGNPLPGDAELNVSALKNDALIFSVKDNGIGIDTEYAQRIFEIFQCLHPKGKYTGTGIGLAVCKKIVERHGGQIWIESERGKGSTFFFNLSGAK